MSKRRPLFNLPHAHKWTSIHPLLNPSSIYLNNVENENVERRCIRKEKERYRCSVTIKTFDLTVRKIATIFSRTSSSYHILIVHPDPSTSPNPYPHSALTMWGWWSGLAPPPLFGCVRKFFHYVSGKFFPVARRLSNLADTVEYSFFLKIMFRIWETVQNIHSF
jgi:hypothetical protein